MVALKAFCSFLWAPINQLKPNHVNSQHGILLHVYSSCNVKLNILGVSLLLKQKNNYALLKCDNFSSLSNL